MKPTEMYFEPILIGFATLSIAAMMGSERLEAWLRHAEAGELAAWLAAAYFVGIVVDRVCDAVLDPLNHHHRLQFALKQIDRQTPGNDPFPEDQYHVKTMEKEQASEYVYFLRSRIRLMRAMIVLTPAAGVAVALRVSTLAFPGPSARLRAVAIAIVAGTYLVVIFEKFIKGEPAIKTYDLRDQNKRDDYVKEAGSDKPFVRFVVRNDPPLAVATLLLAGLAGAVAFRAHSRAAGALVTIGTLLAIAIIGWSWWRVTGTFHKFLRNYSAFAPKPEPPADGRNE